MARLQFSHVHIWGEPPATPAHTFQQQEQDDNCDNGPQSPCNFMPQSSEPVMCLSSTTRRTRKSVDERAIRLLLPTRNGYQDAEDFLSHEREGKDGEDEDATEGEERRDFLDINQTPKTPPKTPLTPTTDTLLTSRTSAFSFASFTAVIVHFSLSRRVFLALVILLALSFMLSAAAVAVLKIESLRHGLFDSGEVVWRMLVLISEAAEVAIEGVGFALGRAIARYGRGFERGYRL